MIIDRKGKIGYKCHPSKVVSVSTKRQWRSQVPTFGGGRSASVARKYGGRGA